MADMPNIDDAIATSPLRPQPRFPGDQGRSADVPLDAMPKPMDMAEQTTDLSLGQVKPGKGPRMPNKVKQGSLVQQISMPDPRTEALSRIRKAHPEYEKYDDDLLAEAISQQYPNFAGALVKPVVPAPAQGPLSAIKNFITAPPGTTGLPTIPRPPIGLALGPGAGLATSLLTRSLGQGGTAAADAAMKGERSPLALATEAGKGAAFSAGAEKVLGPLANFISRQVGAKGAKAAYETAKGTHADDTAKQIAQDLIDRVPALKGTEASGKGLYDAIYGAGKGKVSAAFDDALKEVIEKGAGKQVQLPSAIAEKLGFAGGAGDPLAGVSPSVIEALRKAGRLPAGAGGTPGQAMVDAAELAKKVTGLWRKDPQAYRAAVRALDEAGIGDPAARAAYKAHTGISEFVDKAKALNAEGALDPEKILKALADLKKVGILQRRGLGSGTEGVIQQSARGGPKPPEISTAQIPWYARHAMGAAPGAAIGSAAGPLGASAGGILGAILGHQVLPKEIVTKGPLSPTVNEAGKRIMSALGLGAREALAPYQSSTGE